MHIGLYDAYEQLGLANSDGACKFVESGLDSFITSIAASPAVMVEGIASFSNVRISGTIAVRVYFSAPSGTWT